MRSFPQWLAAVLEQTEMEVRRLLTNESATQFLLAWALFESKCFHGDLRAEQLKLFVEGVDRDLERMDDAILDAGRHFHVRYQDVAKLNNLMPKRRTPRWMVAETREILNKAFNDLDMREVILLVAYVTYRYRNNMFHGAKGVRSWLHYEEQIRLCTGAMQAFINCAEQKVRTLGAEVA